MNLLLAFLLLNATKQNTSFKLCAFPLFPIHWYNTQFTGKKRYDQEVFMIVLFLKKLLVRKNEN
jgi:hypothetical protein